MILTKWYPGQIKPAMPGVYECVWEGLKFPLTYYNYFDGELWHYGFSRIDDAIICRGLAHPIQEDLTYWRGTVRTCVKCGGSLILSKALEQTWGGVPEWPGDPIVTLSPAGPGRLIDCAKCERCGWSVTI